ncbi:acetolactate synthase 2 small subunit [Thalassotalea aquiviva]|uniref:acetolactate synthase 2 small subunit n=1 Tax=Thalassotalea aquiviva TaxID=3242415 RepID=UPI00352B8736
MSVYMLDIKTSLNPLVLERILQVTRYRGFQLQTVAMYPATKKSGFVVQLSVESDKSVKNLKKQLLKIIDIEAINIDDQGLSKIFA